MAESKKSGNKDSDGSPSPFTQWVNSHGDIIGGVIVVAFIIMFIINIF